MPTAYLKKLAKLNNISVNTLEKFWSQAKEIAKSEGQGKSWGLITSIFQNKLKKEGYKVKALFIKADTDELDDADLGINVDPKEYHKQKSLQMSMQSKLDMIKKDLNKEADRYNNEIELWANELNKRNRRTYADDNRGDFWLKYDGLVDKDVLIEAFKDGSFYDGRQPDKKKKLKEFENGMLKTYLRLLNKKKSVVYRGLNFFKYFSKDKENISNAVKYLKYTLMDRNSWTLSKEKARSYADSPYSDYKIVLKMTCSLEDVNLPLSAWLEGNWSWFLFNNKEINIRKSFKVRSIEVIELGKKVESLFNNSSKIIAMYEPDTLDSATQNKLDYINKVKECIKQIWARGTRNQQEQFAKEWVANYSRIIDDCLNAFEEPKVCARMMYIKYHKENPQTRDLNKNKDTDFYTLLKEAKQYFEGIKKFQEDFSDFDIQQTTIKAFKEETRTSESGQTFKFQRLSLSSIQKLLKYYLEDNEWDSNTHWNDLYDDNDGIVYIEYNDNKTFYSVTNPLLKDLKTTNIRNCIIEYPSYTAYFGKDCRIEKFDSSEDSPYVKSYKGNNNMKSYLYKGEVITASSKQEAIHKIIAKADEDFVDRLKKIGFHVSSCIDRCYGLDYGISGNISVYFKNNYKSADVSIRTGEDDYEYVKNISGEKVVKWCEKNRNLLNDYEMFGETDVANKIKDSLTKLK